MVNDHLSHEEAKKYIDERVQEVEKLYTQKQLGYADNSTARWVLLTILVVVVALVFLF